MTHIDHPQSFKEGVRVLLLMLRAKDGGSAKTDRKATKKVVTQSSEEFDGALTEFRAIARPDERIYSTVNPRSLDKAIRLFKYRQLDADFFATLDKQSFYLDLENRWIGCLKSPQAAIGSLFLFDADGPKGCHEEALKRLQDLKLNIVVHDLYPTRNGAHIITSPFNPSKLDTQMQSMLHKNALMLWSY